MPTIAFTAGSDNGSAITNYEYSLDSGSWIALSPTDSTSPITISGLTADVSYSIRLRATNSAGSGLGVASAAVRVTPVGVPKAPRSLRALPPATAARASASPPVRITGAISNYQYSVDGGGWIAISPADTHRRLQSRASQMGRHSIRLRAISSVGDGLGAAERNGHACERAGCTNCACSGVRRRLIGDQVRRWRRQQELIINCNIPTE